MKEDLQAACGPTLMLLDVALQIPRRNTSLKSLKKQNRSIMIQSN